MGNIRVRPALNHCSLWFHIDTPLALPAINTRSDDNFFPPMGLIVSSETAYLTPIGKIIIGGVLELYRTKVVIVRPDYFNLEVSKEKYWPEMLPHVVTIIRDATNDPQAVVRPEPPMDKSVPQWHVPLLNELFGG